MPLIPQASRRLSTAELDALRVDVKTLDYTPRQLAEKYDISMHKAVSLFAAALTHALEQGRHG